MSENPDDLLASAVAEALSDPFQLGNQNVLDTNHIKGLIPTRVAMACQWNRTWKILEKEWNRYEMEQSQLVGGMVRARSKKLTTCEEATDKLIKNNPGFDPVFMKV